MYASRRAAGRKAPRDLTIALTPASSARIRHTTTKCRHELNRSRSQLAAQITCRNDRNASVKKSGDVEPSFPNLGVLLEFRNFSAVDDLAVAHHQYVVTDIESHGELLLH